MDYERIKLFASLLKSGRVSKLVSEFVSVCLFMCWCVGMQLLQARLDTETNPDKKTMLTNTMVSMVWCREHCIIPFRPRL